MGGDAAQELYEAFVQKLRTEGPPKAVPDSAWLANRLKLLVITYLVGKIKFKLLFHGPKWPSKVQTGVFGAMMQATCRERGIWRWFSETLLCFCLCHTYSGCSWGLGSSLKYWLRCNGIIVLGQNNNPADIKRLKCLKDSRPGNITCIASPTIVDTTKVRQFGRMVDAKVNRPSWDYTVFGWFIHA